MMKDKNISQNNNKPTKVVTFGEVMMRLTPPNVRRIRQAKDFSVSYGGSEANVAVSLAAFGVPTEFVTRLPDNTLSHACIDTLRTYGLGTQGIVFGGKRMGIYFLERGAAMRGATVVYDRDDSAFTTLEPGMINWEEIFKDATWFHWSGIGPALSESCADTCMEAIQIADRMGLTISCDLNFRSKLWRDGRNAHDVLLPMAKYSDAIFGAADEYEEVLHITPAPFTAVTSNEELNLQAYTQWGREVEQLLPRCKKPFLELRNTVTANHNLLAAVLWSDHTLKHTGIYDVVDEVDRLGAGDAFVAGMVYGLLHYPHSDQQALNFALAASALKNTISGDFNLSSVEEVERLIERTNE